MTKVRVSDRPKTSERGLPDLVITESFKVITKN